MITRIGSITLEVPKLAESVAFFEQKVGLSVTEEVGSTCFLTSTERHHEMVLVQSETGQTALRHLNLEVTEGQLEACVSRAVAAGARDCGAIDHAGISEGRVIEIPGGFGVKLYTGMQIVAAPSDAVLPRPTNFSHLNIGVPEVARIVDFMMAGLGLRPSDWLRSKENPFLAFLHCPVEEAAHHGIAILESEEVKLHHIAFDYQTVNDVAARVDNYVDQSHYLVWGMGRHGTGGSIFAYIEDVSGMLVELGSGMIRVDHDPRWLGPQVWSLEDPRAVDEWGSSVPEQWLGKRVDVLSPVGESTLA
jgi:catechol 2,3-dioxygenase-like lactoylglutathione lyase family enzyme